MWTYSGDFTSGHLEKYTKIRDSKEFSSSMQILAKLMTITILAFA